MVRQIEKIEGGYRVKGKPAEYHLCFTTLKDAKKYAKATSEEYKIMTNSIFDRKMRDMGEVQK